MKEEYRIDFMFDEEAGVWVATSEDVRGLVLENDSLDLLMSRVRLAAPELLELNCGHTGETNLIFCMSHHERLAVNG